MDSRNNTIEAEAAVLGAILVDPGAVTTALGIVESSDFLDTKHGTVFRAVERLNDRREPIDLLTVTRELDEGGKLVEAGGAVFVSGLLDALPDVANVGYYAGLVKRDSDDRKALAESQKLTAALVAGRHTGDLLPVFLARMEQLKDLAGTPWAATNGVSWADERQVGIKRPEILAGPMVRPSWMHLYSFHGGGKTLITLGIGLHAAAGVNLLGWAVPRPIKVLYIDGELGMKLVRQRINDLIRGHGLDDNLIAENFWIEGFDRQDSALPALGNPRFKDLLVKYPDIDLVLIDNVRTLTAPDFSENEVESWSPINDNLKHIRAKGVSVITNHHGNRAGGFNGSAAQGTLADLLVKVKRHNGDGQPFPVISFVAEKNRHGVEMPDERWELYEPAGGGLAWGSGGPAFVPENDATESESDYQARIVAVIESKSGIGKSKLYKAVGGRRERFDSAVEAMVFQGIINRDINGQKHRHTLPNRPHSTNDGTGRGSVTDKRLPPNDHRHGTGMGSVESSTGPTDSAPFRGGGTGSVGGPSDVPTVGDSP